MESQGGPRGCGQALGWHQHLTAVDLKLPPEQEACFSWGWGRGAQPPRMSILGAGRAPAVQGQGGGGTQESPLERTRLSWDTHTQFLTPSGRPPPSAVMFLGILTPTLINEGRGQSTLGPSSHHSRCPTVTPKHRHYTHTGGKADTQKLAPTYRHTQAPCTRAHAHTHAQVKVISDN